MNWKKYTFEEIKSRVFKALSENINFYSENILGIPGSHLDPKVFNQDAPFLKEAPYISTLINNPNHIGCHTLGSSEPFFNGTQTIERELITICAEDILKAEPDSYDGYVASGGTEANIQAIWVYRNYFIEEFGAKNEEVAIICSQDSHYSMNKAANLLSLSISFVEVDPDNRKIDTEDLSEKLQQAKTQGKKYFIAIANMMTTMFGSVDNIDETYVKAFEALNAPYKLHIDAAYGGFFYPFTDKSFSLNFSHPSISSVTLDAHKMLQAPYGTGIFLIRKNLIQYANTKASYVKGEDFTLIGSRSGANAIAVWMILMTNGPFGWREKILILLKRAEWFCKQLKDLGVEFYRNPHSNIITMRSKHLTPEIAEKYGLVPDDHYSPNWYKVVIMEHVVIERLLPLVENLKSFATKS